MARHPIWAVAGSRVLTRELSAPIERWCWQLSGTSARVAVGCCRGVDHLVLSCLPPRQLRVFAAFAPDGAGAGRWSAVAGVQCLAREGARVRWLAGGPLSLPLRARLARRTAAVVVAATAGLVVFPASPDSRGTWFAARLAIARGLPVVAVPLGFPVSRLPPLGAGVWVPAALPGVRAPARRWVSGQGEM